MSRAMSRTPSMARAASGSATPAADYSQQDWIMATPLRIRLRPHAPLPTRPLLLAATREATLALLMARLAGVLDVSDSKAHGLRIEIDGFTVAQDEDDVQVGALIRETDVVDVYLDEALGSNEDEEAEVIDAAVKALVGTSSGTKRPLPASRELATSSFQDVSREPVKARVEAGTSISNPDDSDDQSSSSSESSSESSSSDSSQKGSADEASDSDDDSESSESSSSSASSSSEDSDSDTSSLSRSATHKQALPVKSTIKAPAVPANGWVPPGEGSAQTKRNNRARRRKERKAMEEERERLFIEAKERAEKRAADEYVMDTNGTAVETHSIASHPHKKQKLQAVFNDSEHDLPPGGGGFGLASSSKPSTPVTSSKSKSSAAKAQKPKPVPPPTLRGESIPPGVRLTRFDCDGCFNAWPAEEEAEQQPDAQAKSSELQPNNLRASDARALYAAFQAQGKAALEAMRKAEETQGEAVALTPQIGDSSAADASGELILPPGMPMAFGKPANWEGHGIVASQKMQPVPMGTSDISLVQPPSSVTAATSKKPARTSQPAAASLNGSMFLDYRDPAERARDEEMQSSADEGMGESLRRLRELRDLARMRAEQHKAAQQAGPVSNGHAVATKAQPAVASPLAVPVDLAAIRSAALASRKKKAALAEQKV